MTQQKSTYFRPALFRNSKIFRLKNWASALSHSGRKSPPLANLSLFRSRNSTPPYWESFNLCSFSAQHKEGYREKLGWVGYLGSKVRGATLVAPLTYIQKRPSCYYFFPTPFPLLLPEPFGEEFWEPEPPTVISLFIRIVSVPLGPVTVNRTEYLPSTV